MLVYAFSLIILILWAVGITWQFQAALRDITKLEKDAAKLCPCF